MVRSTVAHVDLEALKGNFRAIQDGMNLLFLNAVFKGPAHARVGGAVTEEQ